MAQTLRTSSFQAEDIFDRLYTVDIYDDRDGGKLLRLRDGSLVQRLEQGRYEIIETGFGLTSTDPQAL